MEVAKTILTQLGGNKFIAFTGAKELLGDDKSLNFKFGENKSEANHCQVILNGDDTYDMVFTKIPVIDFDDPTLDLEAINFHPKEMKRYKGIYCDMLRSCFTEFTGLYLSF